MKKIMVLTVAFALAATTCFAFGGSATSGTITFESTGQSLRAGSTNSAGTVVAASADSALISKASTGVDVAWQTDANGYALMTQHKSGTKAYGSSYDSTAIYQTTAADVTPGAPAYNNGALSATDTGDFSNTSWKAM